MSLRVSHLSNSFFVSSQNFGGFFNKVVNLKLNVLVLFSCCFRSLVLTRLLGTVGFPLLLVMARTR